MCLQLGKMMNFLALSLLIATLTAASVRSPQPQQPEGHNDVILKEGHRVIVLEYEREGIRKQGPEQPPPEKMPESSSLPSRSGEQQTEKFNEAPFLSSNRGQASPGDSHSVKDRICDAYGKCKEKISTVIGRGKDKAADPVEEGLEKTKTAGEEAMEKAKMVREDHAGKGKAGTRETVGGSKRIGEEAVEKTKQVRDELAENVGEVSRNILPKTQSAGEETARKARQFGDKMVESVEEGSRHVADKAERAGEEVEKKAKELGDKMVGSAEEAYKDVKEMVQQAKEATASNTKQAGERLSENLGGSAEKALGKAKQAIERAKSMGEEWVEKPLKEKGREIRETGAYVAEDAKNLTDIVRRAREVSSDAWACIISPEAVRAFMGLLHLLAFAATYGACIWVTFVSSHVLARSLQRQQFGMVQSRIYPVYFRAVAYGVGLSLLGHLSDRRKGVSGGFQGMNLLASLAFVLANMLFLEPRASKAMIERLKLEKEEGRGMDIEDMVAAEPVAAHTTTAASTLPCEMRRPPPVATFTAATATATATEATPLVASRAADAQEAIKVRVTKLNRRLKNLNTSSSFINMLTLMALTWHLAYFAQRLHTAC